MQVINHTVSCRHPKNFSEVQFVVSSVRHVVMVEPNGGNVELSAVDMEIMEAAEFDDALVAAGAVVVEHFFDTKGGYNTVRGVIVTNGVKYHFIHRHDVLHRQALDDIINCAKYTMPLELK